ncbi:MAG: transposase [Spirosomataceae bacterium]
MPLYKNKYRIESARLRGWDYASEGAYFITICTKDRQHFFGECAEGKMVLSTIGAIVQGFWFEIPKHFPSIQLGEFVVMPNHIHGILVIDYLESHVETLQSREETLQCNVSTEPTFFQQISPKPKSISAIVRSYKAICTKHIKQAFPSVEFGWQERFWDTIIRDNQSFETISNYIVNNPLSWHEDKFGNG